jgi:hypothetical protein
MAWYLVEHRDNFTLFNPYKFFVMLSGPLATTAWHILRFRMEEMASSCGRSMRIY